MLEFVIKKQDLVRHVNSMTSLISSSGVAMLRNVHMYSLPTSEVVFACTNGEIEYVAKLPCHIGEHGVASVLGREFCEIVKKLPDGDICVRSEHDGKSIALVAKDSGSRFALPGNVAGSEPNIREFPSEARKVPALEFLDALDSTAFILSEDPIHAPASLASVWVKDVPAGTCFAAISPTRLAKTICRHKLFAEPFNIPRRGVDMLRKMLPREGVFTVAEEGSRLFVGWSCGHMNVPLRNDPMPDIDRLLSDVSGHRVLAIVPRLEFKERLARLAILESVSCDYFATSPSQGSLSLSIASPEKGTAEECLACNVPVAEFRRFHLHMRNVIESLARFKSRDVAFFLPESTSNGPVPCGLATCDDAGGVIDGLFVIVMPLAEAAKPA